MRRLFSLAFIVLSVVVVALKVAEWVSEGWWMDSLGFGEVQALYWRWRVEAFIPAFGLWLLVMGTNARLAWHNARWRDVSLPLLGPRSLAGRNHISAEDRARLDLLARRSAQIFIALSALLCGMAAANQFDLWVLALHPPTFDSVPDATFLVGVWPALLWGWNAFGLVLGFTLGLVATIAAFEGVLDFDTHGLRVGDATARHLAFLTALLLMWVGVRCGLSVLGEPVNFGWSASGISGFYERSFTNPARGFFLISSPLLALWFARTAPRRVLRCLGVALFWSGCALFLPLMAPSLGRAVRAPSSLEMADTLRAEQAEHIEITRRAWGLDRVSERNLTVSESDFKAQLPEPLASMAGVQKTPGLVVWPRRALRGALHQDDTGKGLGAEGRQHSELYLERQGGAMVARVLEADPLTSTSTSPLLLECDPSRAGEVNATRQELGAVILQSPSLRSATFTRTPVVDPTDDGAMTSAPTRVRALQANQKSGVARATAFDRLMLAMRFGDQSLLQDDKPVTWHLDPLERVAALAPFVWWTDARPHPVLMRVGNEKLERVFWLVEGCFASRSFPGSAMIPAGDEWSNINYVRQSVLGVCDGATGETRFYLFDPSEPISRAWNALLPGFFRPASQLPAALRAGTRLSSGLVNAQAVMWARYHNAPTGTDEVTEWRKHSDEWRSFDVFDSSERDTLVQQVLIERGGKPGLELLAAYAHWGGTLGDSAAGAPGEEGAAPATASPPLVALLSARDEGDAIWDGHGQTPLCAWHSNNGLHLPLSDPPAVSDSSMMLTTEYFDKFALVPLLDARGDCVGMQVSQGRSERTQTSGGDTPWTLKNRVASTKTRLETPPALASAVRTETDMAKLRTLWKSWKEARAGGHWGDLETIEKQITRLLGP